MLKKRRVSNHCWRWFFVASISATCCLIFLRMTQPVAIEIKPASPFADTFKTFIHETALLDSANICQWDDYAEKIRTNYALVDSVQATLDPAGIVHVELKPYAPCVVINNLYVAAENNQLVACAMYDIDVTNSLISLQVNQEWLEVWDVQQFKNIADRCTPQFIESFSMYCDKPPVIYCTMNEQKNITVLCEAENLCSEKIVSYAQQVKKYIASKKNLNIAQRKWVVDTRFENQIIVYGR